jgi:hypothetical protein
MAMSRGKQALGGGAQGAILGGITGNIANQLAMTRYRDIPTSKAVGVGMALGGVVGAATGFAKAGRGWYRARRETQAVGKAYAGMKERQYKKIMREDIEEALVEMQMKKNPVTKAMLKEIFKKKGKKRVTNKAMLDAIFKQKQKKG